MTSTSVEIVTDSRFGFWPTVNSHGWCVLPPFEVDRDKRRLARLFELRDRTLAKCTMHQRSSRLALELSSESRLTKAQMNEILLQVRECLRLSEDFSEFYREARRFPHYRWIARQGAGRLLRAPTVFEDVVKMICTTNCSWALTEAMVSNLTQKLGRSFDGGACSFPSAEAMAQVTEKDLRKHIRAGYRSPYLLELATRVAEGKLNVERWRSSDLPSDELFAEVRSVKGMGDYAAGNILKLLGRYDYLGLDSWVRAKFYELYKKGRRVSDAVIEKHYAPLGRWRGLFFWLDMTHHWYNHKFPF
jgi:3-methyladenine DNA glycosylase/8-oxoguanine DNA glycosylase